VLKKRKEIGKDENRDPKLDDQAKVKSDGDWIGKEGEVRCQSKIQEGTRRVSGMYIGKKSSRADRRVVEVQQRLGLVLQTLRRARSSAAGFKSTLSF